MNRQRQTRRSLVCARFHTGPDPRGVRVLVALCALALLFLRPILGLAATPPYPQSKVITSLSWDLSTVTGLRKASGSDIWAMTWGADGNLYGAWGDGGGFDGTQDSKATGRTSLGIAVITGTPAVGNPASYTGKNVWGQAPKFAESQATFGGKVSELFTVDGVIYGEGALWTTANCACSDPTSKSGSNQNDHTLIWSSDLGKNWTVAPWKSSGGLGSFLQFGENYQGAFDPTHLYFYYVRDVNADPSHSYLRRMLKSLVTADPATPGHFEYFTGTDSNGTALWTTTEGNAHPVFTDTNSPAGAGTSMGAVYDAPLGRYVVIAGHGDGTGQVGIFEGPNPWGPWATVAYYDDWGQFNESAGPGNGMQFPAKWISPDGTTLWAVFSGINAFDSFNVAKATLQVATTATAPQITAPAAGTAFSPGESVTAQASGSNLSWSVSRSSSSAPFATGTGPSFTFAVPTTVTAAETIRIALTANGGSTFRDYAIAVAQTDSVVGYWKLDEGSGSSVADSSGDGHTGSLINSPKWTAGKFGDALSFSAGVGYVAIPGGGSLASLNRVGVTVSAWIKPASAGGGGRGRIVDKDNNDVGWFFSMYTPNTIQFAVDQFSGSQPNRISTNAVGLNTWQHVAATWDGTVNGGNIHLYVGGVPADGTAVNGSGTAQSDVSTPLTIGNRPIDVARGFDGSIDDVHVYNRVLSASEISALATGATSAPSVAVKFVSTGASYTLATAQVGTQAYTDRTYTVTSLSAALKGGTLVQSANDDKGVTVANHLQLTLSKPATLFVCYSGVATQPPAWLNDGSWSLTTDECALNDGGTTPRLVYSKAVTSGLVTLGGNREAPASSGSYSNYLVIVKN
jgi:hypothetical protein